MAKRRVYAARFGNAGSKKGYAMKIKILNPDYGLTADELRAREQKLAAVCRPDTVLEMECVQNTEVYIDSQKDILLAGRELMEMGLRAEQEGFDAVVIYCGSDPAITALRELLHIPVVGGGMASMAFANTLGYSFSLLTMGTARTPEKRNFISSLGYRSERLCSIRGLAITEAEVHGDREATMQALAREITACRNEDKAEVVVLGCLSFLGFAEELTKRCGIPVVDPCYAPVLLAENLVMMGLSHSKVSYPVPPVAELPK